jgi:hypothetical protein
MPGKSGPGDPGDEDEEEEKEEDEGDFGDGGDDSALEPEAEAPTDVPVVTARRGGVGLRSLNPEELGNMATPFRASND